MITSCRCMCCTNRKASDDLLFMQVNLLQSKLEKAKECLRFIAKRPDLPNEERDADWKSCMKWSSHEARETLKQLEEPTEENGR